MRKFLGATLTLALLAGIGIASRPAAAQSATGTRTDIARTLSEKYSEQPKALGLANTGSVIELFTADDGRTWTLVLTTPGGTSTVVAAGVSWMEMKVIAGRDS